MKFFETLRIVGLAAAVVLVAMLAGCAKDQRAVVDPAAFSFWVVWF